MFKTSCSKFYILITVTTPGFCLLPTRKNLPDLLSSGLFLGQSLLLYSVIADKPGSGSGTDTICLIITQCNEAIYFEAVFSHVILLYYLRQRIQLGAIQNMQLPLDSQNVLYSLNVQYSPTPVTDLM